MESSAELLYLVNLADKNNIFWFSDPTDQIIQNAVDRSKREVLRAYNVLEIRLSGKYGGGARNYLAGRDKGKYSIVDINAWAWIRNAGRIGFSEDELARLTHLQKWIVRIAMRPAVERGLGEWYDEHVHPELLLETS
ncbi:glutathione S-transferase [Penicillium waksmanii]|uniref:glutathione S-transferase n=1 Tax=Penicillium waksmanii TaxID=69791 RepID=UPI0025474C24|nr:glutathione S-transferase [Penicillium waksmanii]KAJ5995896.1 glutathione S-transferase [Penicillium waksmanii]